MRQLLGVYASGQVPGDAVTPDEFRAARLEAGLSTQKQAAEALESDLRTVQRWEGGERPVPGPARVALRLLAEARRLKPGGAPGPQNG